MRSGTSALTGFGCVLTLLGVMLPGLAFAHGAGGGFVMLLPTNYVVLGGAMAVLVSFALVALVPDKAFATFARKGRILYRGMPEAGAWGGILVALWMIVALVIGFTGPSDPADNLLPLTIWTLWWVVAVLLHPIFGPLAQSFSPWRVLAPIAMAIFSGNAGKPRLSLPAKWHYWPAFILFFGFAWFQLVYPAPTDPGTLALVVSVYCVFTLGAIGLFGPDIWLRKADPFAIFLSQLSVMSALERWKGNLRIVMPGSAFLRLEPLVWAGTGFVLLTLSSISFDGFSNTFVWLSMVGINPLDYPGRTDMIAVNTLGLAGSFLLLAIIYVGAIALGWVWAGRGEKLERVAGRFIYSIIPISIAFHFAHYMGDTLVQLQYLVLALNDPFESGLDLFGLAGSHVSAGFQNSASGTVTLFFTQTFVVIIGHLLAVAISHAMAVTSGKTAQQNLRTEIPLAGFMILYTAFGLWLLATPKIV